MKTQSKVVLHEWFGKGVVMLLNLLARFLGSILSIDHTLEKAPKRIVVCKFLGMGSIIQATPLLQTLRSNFPNAEIIFVTSTGNKKLLESIKDVNRVYCIDDSGTAKVLSSMIQVLLKFWKHKPDLYIDLETYSYFSTALATMSCARNRFGFYRIERNIRMGVYTHMMFFNARAPIAQSYLQMARLIGCKTIEESLYSFEITETDKKSAMEVLDMITSDSHQEFIIVNPNASDLRIERRWPQEKFGALVTKLHVLYPQKVFLFIGSKSESLWVEHVIEKLDHPVKEKAFNTAGLFSLTELFAVINAAELVITNDTGPMHISFALGKPTVCLFGPASPSQYGQNPNAFGIYKNIYCSPCVHDFLTPPCKGDNQCMKQITVDEVSDICVGLISGSGKSLGTKEFPLTYLKSDHKSTLGIVERK